MKRSPLLVPLVLACALVSLSCSSQNEPLAQKESSPRGDGATTTTPDDPSGPTASLDWSRCTGELTSQAGLQCATLDVPLDPAEPDGDTVELALARKQSTGKASERIGSLVLNPGGPGGSGLEFLANASLGFPEELTDHFDLVSFDPRGVGESDPVRCLTDAEKEAQLEGDLTPDTPQEEAKADADTAEMRTACEKNNPDLIRHMSTADVAADLDEIRSAVGDEQLNYVGFSYGTSIGATYATLFPENIRAMVLDGSVSPTSTPEEEATVQATGFDRTLANFVAACDAAGSSCALAPDAAGAIESTRASLESDPIEVSTDSGTRTLGPDQFDYGLASALYDSSMWGAVASAIADLRDGGAETMLMLMDRQTGRQSDGSFDNSTDARSMVSCADERVRLTPEQAKEAEARIAAAAPTFGPFLGTGLDGCSGWPEPANPLPAPTAVGAPPILVIGTVGDPATPYEWAQQMSAALTGSVLLTYEGDGHTAFLRGGECVDDAVVAYLVSLTAPAPGTRCPAQETATDFGSGGTRDMLVKELSKQVPEEVAECIVDGMISEVGEAKFNQLLLESDQEQIAKLATSWALKCATKG